MFIYHLAAEVRAARSLWEEPAEDDTNEIDHDDIDDDPSKTLLDNPNLVVIRSSPLPLQDQNTISAPSAAVEDAEMTTTQSPIVKSGAVIDVSMAFDWNLAPSPEPSPPHSSRMRR